MAEKLFSDIISGQIALDCIQEWLAGKDTKIINSSLNRTDFVFVVLKYIQDETTKFLPASLPSSTTQRTSKDTQSPEEKLPVSKDHENELKLTENLFQNQRAPFQAINKVTPTRTISQQFSKNINHGHESRRDHQQISSGLESRNILTSTPVNPRKNNSRNDHFPISPPSSFYSDQSSLSHTPRSSKSSRFNSSPGSHHLSPNSPISPPFSPSSPQYHDSFPGLGGKGRTRTPQSPCLGDFIKTKPASQKSRKRIKPTQLSTPEKDSLTECKKGNDVVFGAVSRPFVPMTSIQTEIKEQLNFDEERNLLKEKRIQILKSSQNNSSICPPSLVSNTAKLKGEEDKTPPKLSGIQCLNISGEKSTTNPTSSPASGVKLVTLDPDPSLVKCVVRIKRLASVYSDCLDANFVPNITSELYNIFTILTAGYKSESANSSRRKSAENTKESSSSSESCNNLLKELSLQESSRYNESNSCSSEEVKLQGQSTTDRVFSSVHDCVMFSACVLEKQIHTLKWLDKGLIRFLTENARLSLFNPNLIPRLTQIAEIKEAEEAGCTSAQKPVLIENGPVLYQSETDNKDNFSSHENFYFFKKQRDGFYEILHEWRTKNSDNLWVTKRFPQRVQALLSVSNDPVNMMHLARLFCAQMTSSKNEPHEDLELAGVSRDRLNLLQARFSKPAEPPGSPRPLPGFPAEQQFYQQFLQLAVGSTFLQHVTDCLVYRLRLLDHSDVSTDSLTIEESKAQVLACITSSCLIAKFLGLVTFLPYKSNTPLSPDTLQAQITVREQVVPPVILLPQLQRALATNRLVVTVPWVVAFLGMMDSVAPYLSAYRPLLQLLTSVYKAIPLPQLSSLSNVLLRCSLGWLFDATFFPQQIFFSLIANTGELDTSIAETPDADVRDVVDQRLLSTVCPYLGHLRHLLAPSAGTRQGTARHITPVPAQLNPSTQLSQTQTMELKLEECFLNSQSKSFRHTIDIIVDRIAALCNDHICSNIIAPAKEKASEEIIQRKEEFKIPNKPEVQTWIAEKCHRTEAEIKSAVVEYCGSNIEKALYLLLFRRDITNPTLCRTTHAICTRRCRERIVNWLNSHVKLTDIFSKLIPAPDSKPATDLLKPSKDRKAEEPRDSAKAPADMIIELQDVLCECIERRNVVMSSEQLMELINSTLGTVKQRSDLIAVAEHTIFTLTVDLCIVLLTYAPWLVTAVVVSQLCAVWSACGTQGNSQLERVMSARNTMLLCQGGAERARESWRRLSFVLVELLKHSPPLLTPSQLEEQCVALFRLDWPPMVLSLMGACLSSMLEQIKEDPICKEKPKFVLMLEWVNEMTEDLSKDLS